MKRLQRAAVLLSLIEEMTKEDSWCGETNIQKASYFLQELCGVQLEFDFILYKYGPYSFDLSDELTALRADSILDLKIRDPRYGPCYELGDLGDQVLGRFGKTIARYREHVKFVASRLGSKGIAELERVATALYVRLKDTRCSEPAKQITEITRLKPHIFEMDAKKAVEEVEKMCEAADALRR